MEELIWSEKDGVVYGFYMSQQDEGFEIHALKAV